MKIKRNIFESLDVNLSKPDIQILLGARQVGKSTLMADLMGRLKEKGLPYQSYNLEFPDDLLFFSKPERELFQELTQRENTFIFIDEFHYLENASKLFKAIYDLQKGIKIIASGSSSLEVHKHLKESLAGRRNLIKIFPLLWEEWKQTQKSFEDFLVYGAMPGLVHLEKKEEKIEYLYQIVETYLLKDIKGLIKEENIRSFNHILFFLAENQGQILPSSNIASEVRMNQKTLEHYLQILEQTFTVYGLHSFSSKLSNELKKSKKYYVYDTGIRNSLVKNFASLNQREDIGTLYESHIFLELHKRLKANVELRFWRTKAGDEVDFIWIENQIPIPIEVKSRVNIRSLPKSLIKFLTHYKKAPYGVIFNREKSEDIEVSGFQVKIRTFEEVDSVLP